MGSNIGFAAVSLHSEGYPKKSEFALRASFFHFFSSLLVIEVSIIGLEKRGQLIG
jgi:hypothetical protein